MTQKELGKLVGLSPGSIGAMENDLYTPNFDVMRVLKKRLNASYDYIIDGVKSNSIDLQKENERLKSEIERLTRIVDKLLK